MQVLQVSSRTVEAQNYSRIFVRNAWRLTTLFFATWLWILMGANAATINVTSGMNLNLAMETALDDDTILVGPGTYTVGATPTVGTTNTVFRIL